MKRVVLASRISKIILLVGSVCVIGTLLALFNAVVVMLRAEALAGDRPYCIQYASQTDPFAYEPALTLSDLTAIKMQARLMTGGSPLFRFQHHALLVIGNEKREFFNWSYTKENFLDEVTGRKFNRRPAIHCNPEPHYAKRLPIWSPDYTRKHDFWIGERLFSIPQLYRPRRTEANKLVITAEPLDFQPFDSMKRHERLQFYSNILVTEGAPELSSVFQRRLAFGRAEIKEREFNLDKTEVLVGRTPKEWARKNSFTLYTAHDFDGRMVRLIECSSSLSGCRHQFSVNGISFSLQMRDPSQWLEIEKRLGQVFFSFEVSRGL